MDLKKIYNSTQLILNISAKDFYEFLDEDLDNPFLKNRDAEDFITWLLFDCDEFEKNSDIWFDNYHNYFSSDIEEFKKIKKILKDSYVSIFEIKEYENFYELEDLILGETYKVLPNEEIEGVQNGFGLLRIFGKNEKMVLQLLDIIDDDLMSTFMENLISYINYTKSKDLIQEIDKNYLKNEFLNILSVFEVSLVQSIEENISNEQEKLFVNSFYDDDYLTLFDENFELSFNKNMPNNDFGIDFLKSLMSNIFFKYLSPKEETFKNYNLDYSKILDEMCKSGDFPNENTMEVSLNILTSYYNKLKSSGKKVDNILKSLEYVKKNIFIYSNKLKNSKNGVFCDSEILKICEKEFINNKENKFLQKFEDFLTFLDINYVYLLKSKDITPVLLTPFVNDIGLEPTKNVKNYKNRHFPLVELFLNYALTKKIATIPMEYNTDYLELNDNVSIYLSLPDSFKLANWITTIANNSFLKDSFSKNYEKYKDFIIDLLKEVDSSRKIDKKRFTLEEKALLNILIDLNILDSKKLNFTNFGKELYNYYNTDQKKYDNIIKIDFT